MITLIPLFILTGLFFVFLFVLFIRPLKNKVCALLLRDLLTDGQKELLTEAIWQANYEKAKFKVCNKLADSHNCDQDIEDLWHVASFLNKFEYKWD